MFLVVVHCHWWLLSVLWSAPLLPAVRYYNWRSRQDTDLLQIENSGVIILNLERK